MGPRLGRVEYETRLPRPHFCPHRFNGATLRTRGIRLKVEEESNGKLASMGPRLGRVEYPRGLRHQDWQSYASMGPRLGRVEY